MRRGGVEARAFNPLHPLRPFGWVSRDHRKVLAVDGRVAYVTGLCVGDAWQGHPGAGREPWRDTGIELQGPKVGDVERAFPRAWETAWPPRDVIAAPGSSCGPVNERVIATEMELMFLQDLELSTEIVLAALAFEFPRAVAIPFVILGGWAGLGLLYKAYQLRAQG
ncbi:MAG TPA: hypothetical protein VNT81_06875 [Vicinamibacterales bacterium]|nr:hypothetical protein [Vicinamibacterales bacterium]